LLKINIKKMFATRHNTLLLRNNPLLVFGLQSSSNKKSIVITQRTLIYDSITDTIGKTPVVRVNNLEVPNNCTIYAKCEFFNPLSSVKDRLALAVILEGEKSGQLKKGQTVIEATSGNTGIALAMVCAQRGYPLVITMAEPFSVERRRVMRMLGAKVIITPAALRGSGMVAKAKELAKHHGWFWTRQFENVANPRFHASTTGPEILSDFAGKRLDYWVTGYGTGGTVNGAGKVIKAARPEIEIVLAEPTNAALVSSGEKQKRNEDGTPIGSHPKFTPHPVQGWTPDFIPQITEDALDQGIVNRTITVTGDDSIKTSCLLASKEGIFTGISGGASMKAALDVAKSAPKGSVILTMLPDTAERYVSTPLFASFPADMNEEEVRISKSTPYAQLG
jgi:cysteine synthase A